MSRNLFCNIFTTSKVILLFCVLQPEIRTSVGQPRACSVRLYKHTEFKGKYYTLWTIPEGDCIAFPDSFDNAVHSIDTYDLCVILWSGHNCNGKAVRLSRYSFGTNDLSLVQFGKFKPIASSIQVCRGVDVHDEDAVRPDWLGAEYDVPNHPATLRNMTTNTRKKGGAPIKAPEINEFSEVPTTSRSR